MNRRILLPHARIHSLFLRFYMLQVCITTSRLTDESKRDKLSAPNFEKETVQLNLLFCMGLKVDILHQGKRSDCGCLRTRCCTEYLDTRGME
jgi:hypothetical protein